MSSIWEGNIEHILHAVQLRRIVDQLMVGHYGFSNHGSLGV